MHTIEDIKALDTELYKFIKAAPKNYTYGTSGFRYKGTVMRPITLRVGLFLDYFSKYVFPDALGAVITASHNPKDDNGLKLVNPVGEMIDWNFESCMDIFVNTENFDSGYEVMKQTIDKLFQGKKPSDHGLVFVARDTRDSGLELQDYLFRFSSCTMVDFGMLATPIIYWMVATYNDNRVDYPDVFTQKQSLLEAYFRRMCNGFTYNMQRHFKRKRFNVSIDCSNGVGALMMDRYRNQYHCELFSRYNPTLLYNNNFANLNVDCGAEWVHKNKLSTKNFFSIPQQGDLMNVCFVYDGDADRIVFYPKPDKIDQELDLVDGNRICVLYARVVAHFKGLIKGHQADFTPEIFDKIMGIDTGVVYTAYSNNAFVKYSTDVLHLGAAIAKTGVKFVHSRAHEYDIGIYFESNGHGTIIYKHFIPELLKKAASTALTHEARMIADDFYHYIVGQNSINGDAVGNVLLILSSLEILDIDLHELLTCYTDNLSITSKVILKDRTLMKSTDDERILAEPADIQPQIDQILKEYPDYIGFVRPSGTEECCRVYVEGTDIKKLQELSTKLEKIVSEHPKLKVN